MDLPARKTDGIEDEEEDEDELKSIPIGIPSSIAGGGVRRGGNGVPPSIHRPRGVCVR
jgi:hypothetical protein